ncbi:MFS transporter [Frondihabitans sp. VKM Ac-2883]|uniref:MFS transporter n=1 Tax=Frondihabitans sp. VKM Ac-2883 TaxID=2783823 RepID=UPI00188BCA2B|nr:MFS transporter [Frondihabitans sp. VKM Ac-2883]MBF4577537.1 MFS transporter [Frondihabitans sp. VKM Ac-2883]
MNRVLNRIGLPSNLVWGYVGLVLFMVGDGVEQGWLSPYLASRGIPVPQTALLITVYGITVAIAAWLSGVLVQTMGPRRVMLAGTVAFVMGTIGFVGLGIPHLNWPVMLVFYAIRGIGYPLFAYSFLTWINYSAPVQRRGLAAGWYWFVFSLGLSVIGPFYSSFAIPLIGNISVLWTGGIFVLVGSVLGVFVNRAKVPTSEMHQFSLREVSKAVTLLQRPVISLGLAVKTINGLAQYGLPVFMPIYLATFGFSTTEWLQMWGLVFTVAIFANLFFGYVGDKIGWRRTIAGVGGIAYAAVLIVVFITPHVVGHNFPVMTTILCLCGVTMAGFVPLSALFPLLAPDNKGAAMSILNLGAGLSTFVAPALAAVFFATLGAGGVIGIYAALYVVSAILTPFLKTPEEQRAGRPTSETGAESVDADLETSTHRP